MNVCFLRFTPLASVRDRSSVAFFDEGVGLLGIVVCYICIAFERSLGHWSICIYGW